MKKFLSLVLALVMTMSLVTISAGAKDFTDGDDIQYTEAVDVISAIDVVDGYTDGSFNPDATLTRGAAAKIICNLLLGPTTASALSADAAPFSDVPTTNTFAGYIAYCSQQGIISGYADGTFRPAGTLTSYAFMKMLLGALGYDAEREGYVGANWSVQVAKTALGIDLDEGLVDDFNGLKAVTREEACLYAFNTLSANMVRYGETTNIVVGDAQVNITGERQWDKDIPGDDDGKISADGIAQFAERYFTKLELDNYDKNDTVDAFGRPANTWTYKGDKVGTYANTADATYTKSTPEADIYADTGMTTNLEYTVYIDGIKAHDYDNEYAADSKVTVQKGDEDNKIGNGNGAIVNVYKEERIIAIVNTYVGEVIAVEDATSKRDAYIEIGMLGDGTAYQTDYDATALVLANERFDTEAFEVGDIVTFNYTLEDEAVKNVKAAESVTGDVESFTTNKKFSMDGTSYEYGALAINYYGSADIGTQSTVYMDENSYVLYAKEGEDNNKNYALVLNIGDEDNITGRTNKAYLLYTDGTTGVVDLDKNYSETAYEGKWVTFKTNSDEETVLTLPTAGTQVGEYAWNANKATTIATENGKTGVDLDNDGRYDDAKVNSATVIIIKDKNDNFKVYEGVKNIPTIGGAGKDNGVDNTAGYVKSGFLKFLYVDLAATTDVSTGTSKTIFLVGDSNSTMVETSSDKYYVFDAVVDGVLVEDGVMLDYTDSKTIDVVDDYLKQNVSILLTSYAESNGFYTVDIADKMLTGEDGGVVATTGDQIKKVSGNCIDFDGVAYYTADDCVFYRVDENGNLKKSTINGVRTSTIGAYYDVVYYSVNSDAELTGVYWVER